MNNSTDTISVIFIILALVGSGALVYARWFWLSAKESPGGIKAIISTILYIATCFAALCFAIFGYLLQQGLVSL